MSDRRLWVALVLSGIPALLAAQSAAELQERMRRLSELRSRAMTAALRADSLRWEAIDTVRAGALIVLARVADAGRIRAPAARAWSSLDSLYGDAAQDLARQPMLFSFMTQPIKYLAPQRVAPQRVMAAGDATTEDVTRQLVTAGATALRQLADTALADWLGPVLTAPVQAEAQAARVYIELATAPSAAVRRCYGGDPAGCRAALGLLDGGDRVTLWYDADERRALVRKTTEVHRLSTRASGNACLAGHSDADCATILRALSYLEPPLSADARHSVARLALQQGGRQAYRRLHGSAGALSQRLSAAANLPIDSLMLRWRAEILAARPKPVTLVAAGGWVALGWSIVFGLLALRSTRWR